MVVVIRPMKVYNGMGNSCGQIAWLLQSLTGALNTGQGIVF